MTRRAKTDLAMAMAGLALLLLSAVSVSAVTSTSPQVDFSEVTLTGLESTSSIDFLGIPFAEPPTGPRRFQPATPKSISSSSEFNATSFGAACPQPACMHARQGCPETYSEDCLFLNVFVPKGRAPKGGWPVFVWIHGGAFVEGTASVSSWSESGVFANKGVMLVTANYRLGALGWMAGGGLEGNYGLSDQREALRWVRDHIAAFGGDDSQITVGGESAGAMSILAHIASPEAAGLFDAAIVESGTIALPYGTPTEPGTFLVELSRKLGCPQDGGGDVAACLRALSSEEINSTVTEMANPGSIVPIVVKEPMELAEPFYPTIGTADLPLHPIISLMEGKFNKVPLLIGQNQDEGAVFVDASLGAHPTKLGEVEAVLAKTFTPELSLQIRNQYPLWRHGGAKSSASDVLSRIATDYMFKGSSRKVASSFSAAGLPVYAYIFNAGSGGVVSPWTPSPEDPALNPDQRKAAARHSKVCLGKVCHGAELPFVFGEIESAGKDEDFAVSRRISDLWARFIKDPQVGVQPDWPAFDPEGQQWLTFSDSDPILANISTAGDAKLDFWDSVGYDFWKQRL